METNRNLTVRCIPYLALGLLCVTVACGGGAVPCNTPFIQVNKTADTNDGVCSEADCSLREAIIRSNTCAATQHIRIPAGTYTLTREGIDENAADTGDLDLTDSVMITGEGNSIIDGNGTDRIFDFWEVYSANLSGLVIRNGLAMYGGGIWSHDTALTINEVTIQGNHTTWEGLHGVFPHGGEILSSGDGELRIYLSDILGNTSAAGGGGIAVETISGAVQMVEISYTTISDNTADGEGGGAWLDAGASVTLIHFEADGNSAGGFGGGISNYGEIEFTNATLEKNSAEHGGGLYNAMNGSFIARAAMLSDNTAEAGGGIYNAGMAHFYQSSIVYNEASPDEGGGAYNTDDGSLLINNTTIGANAADGGGGGVYNDAGNLQFMFATVSANDGEGIRSTGGEATMRNTILSANSGGNCASSGPDSLGYNIDSGESCALEEGSDLSDTDPLLDSLPPAGSWLPAYGLLEGSPAIDTADPDRCSGADQQGVIRPQGAGCDRGAVERETYAAGTGSISGMVWHDLCAVPEHGYPPTPPPGCSDSDGDGFYVDANGILEAGEPGLPDIVLHLKRETCDAATDLSAAVTAADGGYSFTGLAAGTYCVEVSVMEYINMILLPGGWTFPNPHEEPQQVEIVLGEGEARAGINFGWDYQFLPGMPDYLAPTPTPALLSFVNPWVSTKELFYGGPNALPSCGPREAKFQIGLSNVDGVANVNLFLRLKEQSSGTLGGWTGGIPMGPIGNNQYSANVLAEDIPGSRTFGESWVQYQFVALDAAGNAIARSEVFWNITFARCEYRPKGQ